MYYNYNTMIKNRSESDQLLMSIVALIHLFPAYHRALRFGRVTRFKLFI